MKEIQDVDPQESDYYDLQKPLEEAMLELVFCNSYEQQGFGISIYDFERSEEGKQTEADAQEQQKTEVISMCPSENGVILGTNKGEILRLNLKESELTRVISFDRCNEVFTKATANIGRNRTSTSRTVPWKTYRG